MFSTSDFAEYTKWAGFATLGLAVLAIVGLFLKWGIRFRLVGAAGFMLVMTGGLFALSLAPLTRTVIPGSVHYSLVYDNGSTQAVMAVPPQITPTQLEATLRQGASDLFSYGRLGTRQENQITIRARTIVHPEPGISQPMYLGQVKRSLSERDDLQMNIEIYEDKFGDILPHSRKQ